MVEGTSSRAPRNIFGTINSSIARTLKRRSKISRVFRKSEPSYTPDEEEERQNKEEREGALSALRDLELSPSSSEPPQIPRLTCHGSLPLASAFSNTPRSRSGYSLSEVPLTFTLKHLEPSDPECHAQAKNRTAQGKQAIGESSTSFSKQVPKGGSQARWDAIQANARFIARTSQNNSSSSVDQWVANTFSPPNGDPGVSSSTEAMTRRAGNAPRMSQAPQPIVAPAASSHQHRDCESNKGGAPAGDWAFGGGSQPSNPQGQPRPEEQSSRGRSLAISSSSGSDTVRAPPPASRPMVIRPNDADKENAEWHAAGCPPQTAAEP